MGRNLTAAQIQYRLVAEKKRLPRPDQKNSLKISQMEEAGMDKYISPVFGLSNSQNRHPVRRFDSGQ
ncbi:hypothetical protein [Robiginitomaculum antarcticum]|uniref:hypothetical protein n=1 Tax=Robiginitomaculum antarcticum TaxID=437507 RepID=UPI0003A5DCAE|nr:hypothetical protein [Robiginitomaculum antarcticum]